MSGSSPFVHARFYLKRDEFEEIHPFTEQSPIFTFRMGTAEVPRILEDCLKTMRRHDYARFEFSAVAFYCIKEMLDLWNSSIAKVESPGLESFSRWYLENQDEDAENDCRIKNTVKLSISAQDYDEDEARFCENFQKEKSGPDDVDETEYTNEKNWIEWILFDV